MVEELYRVLKPGRLISAHCMLLPTSKMRDGFIGLTDFRGDLIRAFQRAGFIFHSEVTIWKDPVQAMQRTKALGLLHKQIKKDSCMSRQGIPDYLVTMRKPGNNPERVGHTDETFPVDVWQRYASPVWAAIEDNTETLRTGYHRGKEESERAKVTDLCREDMGTFHTLGPDIIPNDTLQYRSARADEDERHIAPLQLEVIRRAIRLWTNPGDIVLSPFTGIGSEGHVALEEGRRFIGAELKDTYYAQARANLEKVAALDTLSEFPRKIELDDEAFDELTAEIENPRPPTPKLKALLSVAKALPINEETDRQVTALLRQSIANASSSRKLSSTCKHLTRVPGKPCKLGCP